MLLNKKFNVSFMVLLCVLDRLCGKMMLAGANINIFSSFPFISSSTLAALFFLHEANLN